MNNNRLFIILLAFSVIFASSYLYAHQPTEQVIISDDECCIITVTYQGVYDGYEIRYDDYNTNQSNIINVHSTDDVDDLIIMHQNFCYNVHQY